MNLMHGNTDNISHIPIVTWPGMTSSLTSHGSLNVITQHCSLNSFHVLPFDTKLSKFKRRWEIMTATQYYGDLLLVSINVSSRKTVQLKTYLWIFPHPNFMKDITMFDVSNGVKCWVCAPCSLSASPISKFTAFSEFHNITIKCC